MRILMLASQLGGRGGIQYAGRLVLRALREWAGEDAQITILSVHDDPAELAALNASCTVVTACGSRLKTLWKAWQLLRGERWDLVLLGHLHLAPLLALASPASRTSIVAMIYGIEAWQPISGLRRRGLLKADRLLYISQHTRHNCEALNPWMKEISAEVCYLGLLPDDDRSPAGTLPSGFDPGRYAVAIGRMAGGERYKGFDELICIWPRVERVHPEFKLVLIGDGNDQPRLKELAAELQTTVIFTGAIDDDLRDCLLRNCGALCLPSRGEGFGLVYLEAMRLGKPVLAGSTDAGREVVADGVTGRTVSGQDPQELLSGILDVLGPRGAAMGLAGRQRFFEHFSYQRFYERFTEQLELAVGSSARTRTTENAAAIG
jgi:glycosyltransferase involved in cell wall biosynthesis